MNFGERERERERERKRETETQLVPFAHPSSSRRRSQAPAPSIAIRDRELAFTPIAIGAVLREIAPSIAILRSGAVFERSRSTARSSNWSSRSTAPSNPVDRERQSGCCVCFSGFIFFLVAFSKHQKIFFGNFFEIQPNT